MLTRASAAATVPVSVDSATSHPPNQSGLPQDRESSPSASDSGESTSSSSSEQLINYAVSRKPHENKNANLKTTKQKLDRRPPSTFHLKSFWEMTLAEKLCMLADTPVEMHRLVPEDVDRGPPPYLNPIWDLLHITWTALPPLVIQQVCYTIWPNYKWHWGLQYAVYMFGLIFFAIQAVFRLNRYALKYGLLDEKNIGRDRTPDKSTAGLARGIVAYVFVRTALPFILHYDRTVENPLFDFTWTYPFRFMAWEIVLDYFFYCYHRSSHEVDALWFIHMHHHTTKHPTHILSILAEEYQEMLEVFLIPSIASYLIPMTLSELWFTIAATMWVEMQGHCGVRAHWRQPILGWPLKWFDMDLAVEDHDLHHRFGKSGKNYGKQTRVWDKIYGTSADRIETYGMF